MSQPNSFLSTSSPLQSPFQQRLNKFDSIEISKFLTSSDPNEVIQAINLLLDASHDHEENYTLNTHDGGLVVRALVICFERCIGWSNAVISEKSNPETKEMEVDSLQGVEKNETEAPTAPSLGKKRKRSQKQTRKSNQPFVDLEKKYKKIIRNSWNWEPLNNNESKCIFDAIRKSSNNKQNDIRASENYDHDTCEWTQSKLKTWHRFCCAKFDIKVPSQFQFPSSEHDSNTKSTHTLTEAQYKMIEAIIIIIRNLSFVAANARHLAYSIGILRVLAAGLHSWSSLTQYSTFFNSSSSDADQNAGTSRDSNACLHSLQALITLVPFLPVTGSKIFADLLLLDANADATNNNDISLRSTKSSTRSINIPTKPPTSTKSSAKLPLAYSFGLGGMLIAKRLDTTLRGEEDLASKIPPIFIKTVVWSHILTITSLVPHILQCMLQNDHRSIVLSALDLMKELLDCPDNRILFQTHIPEQFIERLVDLLYIPRLGPDSLEYLDPLSNMVTRVSALKLGHGYDASIDFDLRDRAAELLDRITQLSPDLKRRVGVSYVPRVVDYLTMMLGTTVGRSDARQLAGGVLANIAMIPENKRLGIFYGEEHFLNLAARDADVANVVCNSLLN